MRMQLREGEIGDYSVFPIYELRFEEMVRGIPTAFAVNATQYTGANGDGKDYQTVGTEQAGTIFNLQKFRVQSERLFEFLPSRIPRQKTRYGHPSADDIKGAICKVNTNIEPHTTFDYESYGMQVLTEQPTDWGTGYNYLYCHTVDNEYTPDDAYRPMVCYPVGNPTWYTQNVVNLKDRNHVTFHKFYTGVGSCHFGVFKFMSEYYPAGAGEWLAPTMGMGTIPTFVYSWNNLSDAQKKTYGICNKNNQPIGDLTEISSKSFHFFKENEDSGVTANRFNNLNWWQFFVHYTLDGMDFYGVCQCHYRTAYDDTDIPIEITCIAMDSRFWGESVISGGESGEGEWGSTTKPTVSGGTFSHEHSDQTNSNHPKSEINDRAVIANTMMNMSGVSSVWHLSGKTEGTPPVEFDWRGIVLDVLYKKFILDSRFHNIAYDPMSAVVASHFIPREFCKETGTPRKMTLAGYPVSDEISTPYTGQVFSILDPISYVEFQTYNLENVYGGYADFSPYTQAVLHLPFIGSIPIDVDYIAHGEIGVTYACDVVSGNVVAWIYTKDVHGHHRDDIATANGNCAYSFPLYSSQSDGSAVGKMIGSGLQALGGTMMMNPMQAMQGASNLINTANHLNHAMVTSGTVGGTNAMISPNQVYLELISPNWTNNMYHQKLKGIPADMAHCIADCGQEVSSNTGLPIPTGIPYDGYLEIDSIDLEEVDATDTEKQEIENLLKSGVYIRGSEIT